MSNNHIMDFQMKAKIHSNALNWYTNHGRFPWLIWSCFKRLSWIDESIKSFLVAIESLIHSNSFIVCFEGIISKDDINCRQINRVFGDDPFKFHFSWIHFWASSRNFNNASFHISLQLLFSIGSDKVDKPRIIDKSPFSTDFNGKLS